MPWWSILKRYLTKGWCALNKNKKPGVLLFVSLILIVSFSSLEAYTQEEEAISINEDQLLNIEISQALAREDTHVTLDYQAQAVIEEGSLRAARTKALYDAFRKLVKLATALMVSEERLIEVEDLANRKIYKKARQFVFRFRTKKSEIKDDKYVLPLKVTLNLKQLYKELRESKVLDVEYASKEIRFLNVTNYNDYQFMKAALEKRIRNLKRIVETHQKKGQIIFLVETSSSLQEIMERLHLVRGQDKAPLFKVMKNEEVGGLEITFIQ
jgi:hypothetical protein